MRKEYEASTSELGQMAAAAARITRAMVDGDADFGVMPSGQVCGRIDDMPSVQEVIERIVAEASGGLESVREKLLS